MWLKDRGQSHTLLWPLFLSPIPQNHPFIEFTLPSLACTKRAWWNVTQVQLLPSPPPNISQSWGKTPVPLAVPSSRPISTCPRSPVAGQALVLGGRGGTLHIVDVQPHLIQCPEPGWGTGHPFQQPQPDRGFPSTPVPWLSVFSSTLVPWISVFHSTPVPQLSAFPSTPVPWISTFPRSPVPQLSIFHTTPAP